MTKATNFKMQLIWRERRDGGGFIGSVGLVDIFLICYSGVSYSSGGRYELSILGTAQVFYKSDICNDYSRRPLEDCKHHAKTMLTTYPVPPMPETTEKE